MRKLTKRALVIMVSFVFLTTTVISKAESEMKSDNLKKAMFGAGCFWGVEKIFRKTPGVTDTVVGYSGGSTENPTYEEVSSGSTGHVEVVQVTYDPVKISYEDLLTVFWQWHDPTTPNRQGPDRGSQYRSVIFTTDADQEAIAKKSLKLLEDSKVYDDPIVTEIVPAGAFYHAEEYHQRYLEKNPFGYCSHFLRTDKVAPLLKGSKKAKA